MKPIEFNLQKWTLNSTFLRVKNCMVTLPPYEKYWYSSDRFFLDKRLWLEEYDTVNWDVVDDYTINWIRYYLVHNYSQNQWYIYAINNWVLTQISSTSFAIDSNSPKRFTIGKWIIWSPNSSWRTVDTPVEWTSDWVDINWTLIPSYAWWYIKFKYTWVANISVWDYLLWRWWALKWWINRVEFIDTNTWEVYIIWTNIRWTIPKHWTEFDLYKWKVNDTDTATITNEWPTLLVWWTQWLYMLITNWYTQANLFKIIDTVPSNPIIDIVNFDWNVFVMTKDSVYFSRTTYEDNTQFYPLDRFWIFDWQKLFSLWKALLCFAWVNKLFVKSTIDWIEEYVWYDVNYDWNLFSKYSCIFADQTIYILQSDKQLKQVDIVQYNSTAYDLKVTDVLLETPWLFNTLDWWEMYINSNQRYINFLYIKNWNTINYQYDKMYKHFIEQHYNKIIYKFTDHILSSNQIFIENWYADDWVEYEQEINFLINTEFLMYKPYILRTIFGLVPNLFKVNLNIEFELWWKIDTINKTLENFNFDNRLSTTITWDELLEDTTNSESTEYNWTIVSIQSNLMKVWRFIRFKYYSQNRFMIGNSYVIADESKTYRNEPLLTN